MRKLLFLSLATLATFTGCQTNTGNDALIGGGAGALVGGLASGSWAGAAIGATAGALVGGVVGNSQDIAKQRHKEEMDAINNNKDSQNSGTTCSIRAEDVIAYWKSVKDMTKFRTFLNDPQKQSKFCHTSDDKDLINNSKDLSKEAKEYYIDKLSKM